MLMKKIWKSAAALLCVVSGIGIAPAADESCGPAGGWSFVCGPAAAEDMVRLPGTNWIIAGGMAEGKQAGRLHLIDSVKKTWETIYPGAEAKGELDAKSYPACPGAPDPKVFSAHGIAIRDDGKGSATLLVVNHGGREAIEVFRINKRPAKPEIAWTGCVPMDDRTFINSVAFLPAGGFAATKFFDPKAPGGFQTIQSGKVTGGVLEWHPGAGVREIPGTGLSGANGIEVSKDGKWMYVASWGGKELVRFSREGSPLKKDVVKVAFSPDNLRWAPDGKILVAGQNEGFKGWTVVKLDPSTMKVTELAKDAGQSPLQNASVAIEVDGTLWLGPFRGDRVAYRPIE
jgi:hypothetical protein